MIDLELVDYIRQNREKYSIEQLKNGLLEQGVSTEEIEEAIGFLDDQVPDHEMVVDGYEEIENTSSRFDFLRDAKKHPYMDVLKSGLDYLLNLIGVKKNDQAVAKLVISFGSISYLMTVVIVTFFQYIAASYVYPKVALDAGVFGRMSLPDVFLLSIKIGPLLLSVLSGVVVGAVGTFVFIRYLLRVWPFVLVDKFTLKMTIFYSLIHIIFGVFLGGVIVSMKGVFILGYMIITVAAIGSSYLASIYFSSSIQQKYPNIIKDLIYKKW